MKQRLHLKQKKINDVQVKCIDGCKHSNADIHVENNDIIKFGDHFELKCLHTPGHTLDDFCFVFELDNGININRYVQAIHC